MSNGGIERDDGVGQNQEVGPAADTVDGIARVGFSRVEMRAGRRREVTASGEPHHPNSIGGQAELLRARADEANRALGVAEFNRVMVAGPESVLEDESGHARRVEQVRDLPSFVVGRERAVATAWRDDDRGARGLARTVDRQGRPISILLTERARRAVRPEEDRFWLGVGIGLGLLQSRARPPEPESARHWSRRQE